MTTPQRITSREYLEAQKSFRRRNKFGAKATISDGIRFDSKLEAARWQELRLMELAGEISELQRQVRIPLLGQHDRPVFYDSSRQAAYVADFCYRLKGESHLTIEDAKGIETPASKLKRAIVAAMLGRPVLVTRKAGAA